MRKLAFLALVMVLGSSMAEKIVSEDRVGDWSEITYQYSGREISTKSYEGVQLGFQCDSNGQLLVFLGESDSKTNKFVLEPVAFALDSSEKYQTFSTSALWVDKGDQIYSYMNSAATMKAFSKARSVTFGAGKYTLKFNLFGFVDAFKFLDC